MLDVVFSSPHFTQQYFIFHHVWVWSAGVVVGIVCTSTAGCNFLRSAPVVDVFWQGLALPADDCGPPSRGAGCCHLPLGLRAVVEGLFVGRWSRHSRAFSLVTFSSHFLAWRDWLTLTSFSVHLAAVC